MHGVEQYIEYMVHVHSKYYPLAGQHAVRIVTTTYTKRQDQIPDKTVKFIEQITINQ